jgi:hypothetical protein
MNGCHMEWTYRSVIRSICRQPAFRWSLRWWADGELIVMTSTNRVWCVPAAKIDDRFPHGVVALGCCGWDCQQSLRWIGWDLDVGDHGGTKHGKRMSYETPQAAAEAGKALVSGLIASGAKAADVELRRSKGGLGCHVRWLVVGLGLTKEQGPQVAKHWAAQLNLAADPTPLGRQAHWLWTRTVAPGAFEAIDE